MNSLINLGKLVEKLNNDTGCVAEAHIQSIGVLIKFRRHGVHLNKLVSWIDMKSTNIDVLAETFNQMADELGCQDCL